MAHTRKLHYKDINAAPETYVGNYGDLWFDPMGNVIRVYNGQAGGHTISGAGPGYLTLPSRNDTQFTIGGGGTLDGIKMTTDRGTVKFGNTPECVPTAASHFHIMKQDPNSVDLFFGDDITYVKLPAGNETVVISTSSSDYTWTFDQYGNLTFPTPSNTTAITSVGYLGLPQHNLYNGTYTLDFPDIGQHIYVTYDSPQTITIPANTDKSFPVGATIAIITNGSSTATIAITTDTLTQLGTGSTGSRTLAANSMATLIKVASTQWVISGIGLS
jgi:hypothetical protein